MKWQRIRSNLSGLTARLERVSGWAAVIVTGVVGVMFGISLAFQSPSEESLKIASGGAIASVTFASLGFGYAALAQGKEHNLARYVGARFGFAAVLLVLGFVLDYAWLNATSVLPFALPINALWLKVLVWMILLCRITLYVGAVFSFSLGAGLAYQVFKDKGEPPLRFD